MILIADSGSTKTEWNMIKNNQIVNSFITIGLNPYFVKAKDIHSVVENEVSSFVTESDIVECNFYGAGCRFESNKLIVKEALKQSFNSAHIQVETDILGAARALFQHSKGIACILGTGSNSCLYNGEKIVENIPSLGYIFGDEGGGVHIGKTLIDAYLHNELSFEVTNKIENELKLNKELIINSVYKEKFPNRFLASFCTFLKDNIEDVHLEEIVKESFNMFVRNQLSKYSDFKKMQLGFIGSVAFYFQDQLTEVLEGYGLHISEVSKTPMEGLAKFHCYN